MMTRLMSGLAASMAVSLLLASCSSGDRVDELMSRMTLEEKIGQLNLLPGGDITTGEVKNSPLAEMIAKGQLGSVLNVKGCAKIRELQRVAVEESRLGIPLIFGQDVIHGHETVFPLALAQACSWDLPLMEEAARVAAQEATAAGISWVYSPMVDVCTDARWGRISEGAGEDPWYAGQVGAALIRGYQGKWTERNVMACVKHYALYGASEAGKDYNMVDMSHQRMMNQYFPPYKACVEVGAGSFMTSFNLVDGIPATANKWLIDDILRKQWGFQGFVVTDYGSIGEMRIHGVGDDETNAISALCAGTDIDMCSEAYVKTLAESVRKGLVSEKEIDTACRRVLKAKEQLGLLDDPYRFCDLDREKTEIYTEGSRATARKLAAESFVLLKNADSLLPLAQRGTIALIGPLADQRNNLPGSWSTADRPEKYKTLREEMQSRLNGKATLLCAQGSNIYNDTTRQRRAEFGRPLLIGDPAKLEAEALNIARKADVIIAAMGEMAEMSGESSSRADITMPDAEMALLKKLVALGKPVVLLNFAGRPTDLSWEDKNVTAILNVWFGGSETADAICDVLFGDVVPTGKTVNSFPRCVGQLPLYYNHTMSGRPVPDDADGFYKYRSNYMDTPHTPLYPFGFGLSYTTFEYSDVRLSADKMGVDGSVTASVDVTNTGKRDADEVVQLYIRDVSATIARPVKELKGFSRVSVKAGEKVTVDFPISRKDLEFYNYDLKKVVEPGEFVVMVGPNSRDVKAAMLTVE